MSHSLLRRFGGFAAAALMPAACSTQKQPAGK